MNIASQTPRIALLMSTSGHSGVDRVLKNLSPELLERGFRVTQLKSGSKGPHLDPHAGVEIIQLKHKSAMLNLPQIVRFLRQEKPDVLLAAKDKINRLALFANWLAGSPCRVVFRFGTSMLEKQRVMSKLDRMVHYLSMHHLYPRAYNVIVPSQGAANELACFAKIENDCVTAVPSPVLTSKTFQLAKQPCTHAWLDTKDIPVIVAIGELSPRKDFATLLQAFALARQELKLRLVLLGKGAELSNLQQLSETLGIAEDVDFAGFQSNPFAYLSKADLYVHSSRFEGSPVALMEALALGVPCVSTDCPSGPFETLQGGKLGRLVPVGDAQQMAQSIIAELDEPHESTILKAAGHRYSVEESANAYLAAMGLPARCLNMSEKNA